MNWLVSFAVVGLRPLYAAQPHISLAQNDKEGGVAALRSGSFAALRMTKVIFRTSALLSFLVIPNERDTHFFFVIPNERDTHFFLVILNERSEVKNLNHINNVNTYIDLYGKNRGKKYIEYVIRTRDGLSDIQQERQRQKIMNNIEEYGKDRGKKYIEYVIRTREYHSVEQRK